MYKKARRSAMEVSLESKKLRGLIKTAELSGLCTAEGECVVPDTQEDIKRLLVTGCVCKISAKELSTGTLTVRGEAELSVICVGEESGAVSQLKLSAPFLAELRDDRIKDGMRSVCSVNIASKDTALLNPRKIRSKCELRLECSCYAESSAELFLPPESDSNIRFRLNEESYVAVDTVDEKSFVIDGEFSRLPFDSPAEKILASELSYSSTGTEYVGSRLIVKGCADIDFYILCADGSLEWLKRQIEFSQLFDVSCEGEEPFAEVSFFSSGEYYDLYDGTISAEVHTVAQLVSSSRRKISVISDAYAPGCRLGFEYAEPLVSVSEQKRTLRASARLSLECPSAAAKIISYEAKLGRARLDDGTVSCPFEAELLYEAAGSELIITRAHSEILFDSELISSPDVNLSVRKAALRAMPSGNRIELELEGECTISERKRSEIRLVKGISLEKEECAGEMPSAYLYRAESEDLWAAAKKYGSDIDKILAVNGLQSDDSISGRLLVIPVL